jgi:hypothetical protein
MVIRRMVQQFALPIEIIGCATARADSGLALSSRNGYLSAEQLQAMALSQALKALADAARQGGNLADLEAQAMAALRAKGWEPDYLTCASAAICKRLPMRPAASWWPWARHAWAAPGSSTTWSSEPRQLSALERPGGAVRGLRQDFQPMGGTRSCAPLANSSSSTRGCCNAQGTGKADRRCPSAAHRASSFPKSACTGGRGPTACRPKRIGSHRPSPLPVLPLLRVHRAAKNARSAPQPCPGSRCTRRLLNLQIPIAWP